MIKSYAKLNVHLGVLSKQNPKYHKIETIVLFADIYDEINIKLSKRKNHKISFSGRFNKGIGKNNTISKLVDILDKMNLLNNKKIIINIKKNIPIRSGMGGGSMNAASTLRFLDKKLNIKLNKNQINKICCKIGSDVILGINNKPKILLSNGKSLRIKKKIFFYLTLLKPRFGCKTSKIYKNIKNFSPSLKISNKLNVQSIKELRNDLEKPAFKLHPSLHKIKKDMENIPNISFARMTGSGSTIIGYFLKRKDAIYGTKYLKKKYNNYWCILSKTI